MSCVRILIWATCFVAAFFATGPIFGWPALQLMLYDEGIYAEDCGDASENLSCAARSVRLNVVFSCGFFTNFAGRILWGILLDRAGPRFVSTLACLTVSLGAVLMSISGKDLDLFAVASALIGIGGPGVHCANFHVSNLFPERKRTVTTSFSAMFGTSGLVFVVCRLCYNAGIGFRVIFVAYAMLLVFVAMALYTVQSPRTFKLGEKVNTVISWRRFTEADEETASGNASTSSTLGATFCHTLSMQLMSGKGIGITLFFTFYCAQLQFYLGNVKEILAALGDDGTYAIVFNMVGSSALLWAPFVGVFLDRVSFDVAFFTVVVFAVACSLCAQVQILEVQVLTFIFWALERLLLFAAYFSFLPATFGFKAFGTITGVTSGIAATVGLVCIPLSSFAVSNDAHSTLIWTFLGPIAVSLLFPRLLRLDRIAAQDALAAEARMKAKTSVDAQALQDEGEKGEEPGSMVGKSGASTVTV